MKVLQSILTILHTNHLHILRLKDTDLQEHSKMSSTRDSQNSEKISLMRFMEDQEADQNEDSHHQVKQNQTKILICSSLPVRTQSSQLYSETMLSTGREKKC